MTEVALQVEAHPHVGLPERKPAASLTQLLAELYQRQLALQPNDVYLRQHAHPTCIANQVRTFHWYRPFLPATGNVLDWGCYHAPDSCLLRAACGGRLTLYSCDFTERDRYAVFHDFADAVYSQLADPVCLPYPSNSFDAVIGSGVLEHTVLDYESLKELYRVIKPGGVVIISYLPNWLSLKEWVQRVFRRQAFHRRLYGLGELKQLLKRAGFFPLTAGYHNYAWERLFFAVGLRRAAPWLAPCCAWLLPLNWLSSTLCCVAQKVTMM
jgi:SAM-dependent methyltransferase